MQKNKPFYLVVEGNIGAGKSTFLRIIKEKLNIDIVYEPTDKWQREGEEDNLLDLFYKDTKRWAYTFQSYAFITRIQAQLEHQKNVLPGSAHVYERSVYCDRYCFAKNCHKMGTMTDMEWHIYKEWFGWLVESYTTQPSGFVYLKTDPTICYERIQKRSRSEEDAIPLEYLQSLHDRHEEWLIEKKEILPSLKNTPILVLDCNEEFETHPEVQKSHLERLANFVAELKKNQSGEQNTVIAAHKAEKSVVI